MTNQDFPTFYFLYKPTPVTSNLFLPCNQDQSQKNTLQQLSLSHNKDQKIQKLENVINEPTTSIVVTSPGCSSHFRNISENSPSLIQQSFLEKPFQIKNKAAVLLQFRIQWTNDYRNVVPNLMNQIFSFVQKSSKSIKLIKQILGYYPHPNSWTANKFYSYMSKLKQHLPRSINQSALHSFFEILEPHSSQYSIDEQHFYMKVSRIAIMHFLQKKVIQICVTSNRMSKQKRLIHLKARQALIKGIKKLGRKYQNEIKN